MNVTEPVFFSQDVEMVNCEDANVCRVTPVIMSKQMLRNLRQQDLVKYTNGLVAICPACHKRFTTKDLIWNVVKMWY